MGSVSAKRLASLDQYFEFKVLPPRSQDADLQAVYALRYEVFCEECGFMVPANYPDGLESDEFDARAAHVVARNKDQRAIGSSRLVCAEPGDPFPYEAHCATFDDFEPPDPRKSAEVSRLALHRDYRRRSGDSLQGVNPEHFKGAREPGERRQEKRVNAPLLVLGLYREMYQYSITQGIRYWYAAMEKPLVRVLAMYGFDFKPIGEEQDYHGPVTPYLGDIRDIVDNLRSSKPGLAEWLQDG